MITFKHIVSSSGFMVFVMVSVLISFPHSSFAQYEGKEKLLEGLRYKAEVQSTFSNGKTPLWLNANRYGLSSLEKNNGYVRAAIERPIGVDTLRRWGVGYGVDVAVPWKFTSKFVVQQAYIEGRWLHGTLTIGSKEYPMEFKSQTLSSGAQTLGINARPVPQVRLALTDYWTLPAFNGWVKLKGHIAYGMMTDDNWQHDFTKRKSKYADNVKYHSKAGYLMIGKPEAFYPISLELGLEMAATFGGTAHRFVGGKEIVLNGETGIKSMWHAFIPSGSETGEAVYHNVAGNQLGSWLVRVNWDTDLWRMSIYADKYFEDHSSMLQLDYDGYGSGAEWDKRKKNRYLIYGFHDWMLGWEWKRNYNRWLDNVVFEYLYTKYQSGPIYHDHNPGVSDHIGGDDNFYNHYIYTGWQHWGQVIGNPLYISPIYNETGEIMTKNNRFMAFHLGLGGHPSEQFGYRFLASWQDGLGTYQDPYLRKKHNVSIMAEAEYNFRGKTLDGWSVKGAFGMDNGHIRGYNTGFQLTIAKKGILK